MQETSRKVGFLEKASAVFNQEFAGSGTVGVLIELNESFSYEVFCKAWRLLFDVHPLLRATVQKKGMDYCFSLNADFESISILLKKSKTVADIHELYSADLVEAFDLGVSMWRAMLCYSDENLNHTYLLWGAAHMILDGRSAAYLLNQLIAVMSNLKQGIDGPILQKQPMPPALDSILDRTLFKEAYLNNREAMPIYLDNKKLVSSEKPQSKSIMTTLDVDASAAFIRACRANNTTVNAALCAALILSVKELYPEATNIPLSTAFDLRPYTQSKVRPEVLAFYAHQVQFELPNLTCKDFWALAALSQERYAAEIAGYKLLDVDDHDLFNSMISDTKNTSRGSLLPAILTNVGNLDGIMSEHDVIVSFHFSGANRGLFAYILSVATINGKICLNTTYSNPPMSDALGSKIADNIVGICQSVCDSQKWGALCCSSTAST